MEKVKYTITGIFLILTLFSFAQQPKLVIPTGNTGRVDHLEFSPDGKFLLSAFGSDKILLWKLSSKQVFNEYKLNGRITAVKFSPVNDLIVAGSTDGSMGIWKYSGEDTSVVIKNIPVINGLVISPNGKTIITCNADTTIRVFDRVNQKQIYELNPGDPLDNAAISHNGKYAAFGDREGKVYLMNLETREKEFFNRVCDGPIHQLSFNDRDSLLAASDGKGMIYLINLQPFKIIYSVKAFGSQAFSISFYKNHLIATGRDQARDLRFFRVADGQEENLLPSFTNNINDPFFIYGTYCHDVSADGVLAVPNSNGTISCWNLSSKREDITLEGASSAIYDLDFDDKGLIYFAGETRAGAFDLKGLPVKSEIIHSDAPILQVSLGINKAAALGSDTIIYIGSIDHNSKIESFRVNRDVFNAPVRMAGDNEVVFRTSNKLVSVKNLQEGKLKNLKIADCYDYKISHTGNRLIAYSNKNEIEVWDMLKWKIKNKIPCPTLKSFDINDAGTIMAGIYENNNHLIIKALQLSDNKEISNIAIPDSINIDRVYLCNEAQTLLSISRTAGKFNAAEDYSIRIWDLKTGKYNGKLTGHTGLISDIIPFNNHTVISGSQDGTIRVWSLINAKELASIIPLNDGEWVVLNERGMFDASPMAMQKLHFIFNNEEINLNQLKVNFYEPKLLQKILGYSDEPYVVQPAGQQYSLYPEIRLVPPDFNDGVLTASFKDQGGGVGKIELLINGKEAIEDARNLHGFNPTDKSFDYTIAGHPYLKQGALNKITVRVYNDKGYKISNEKSIYLLSDLKEGGTGTPDFYGIIIGISDYKGSDIDLTFAAKDAEDFANAIQLGASKYLGRDHVFIHRLTTLESDSSQWPYKKNIEKTFSDIASKAQPKDILLVYISGHGMDNADDNDFYFLTADAGTRTIEDQDQRPKVTISSGNMVRLIKQVPALKQLMIIDACHSGNILSGLTKPDELNSGSIRALENVKDRTGMYILASSEGQEVSYESSLFDQGLLTYSLLFGLKGAGLREGDMADVVNLLQFVDNNVPVLAGDIGKVQLPVIKIPDNVSSFNIGKMTSTEKDKIDIKSPKPIVARSNFQNEITFSDNLQLSQMVDAQLKDYRDLMKNKFIFLDDNFYNNSIQVYGRYKVVKNIITVNYKVYKNNELIKEDNVSTDTPENAAKAITGKLMVIIDQQK